ncbi:molybdopterin-dependent oxidoreductase [Thermodesulforhabdus norvegica]|uniref:Anaerobic selenocysteine-containing dehydrogenase n=1 Tax=Thermodesulforhabdus norvegica TaxID=39841 RepID=A0A1I4U505_9BACT|nr:molybdopterin-dependent oxidoreductase [Thermodesulforhabdus norvegica]SFM84072.1 Anaerobic selenocysteine-containing dehydrogenase [Thermodesulforhabdus norvegica]
METDSQRKAVITACRVDCPDACSIIATKNPDGRWILRGNPEHPVTQGFLCRKVAYFIKRHNSPSRLVHPMLRKGNRWVVISPDEAVDICAEKIQKLLASPERILHVQGHGVRGIYQDSVRYFFASIGSSTTDGSLCDGAGIEASITDFGTLDHNDILDLLNAEIIVNWGKDLKRSSVHLAALTRKFRKKGGRVLTISPGGCDLEGLCDHHVLISPGTDRFLAAALIKELILPTEPARDCPALNNCDGVEKFEEALKSFALQDLLRICGVDRQDFERLKAIYGGNSRVSTIIGWGLQRHRHGGETVRWINALCYLTGHVGKPGEGVYYNISSRRYFNYDGVTVPEGSVNPYRRSFPLPRLAKSLLQADPPIEFAWIHGTNIVNQAPSSYEVAKALKKIPFVVVVDAFFTDTVRFADLFFPSTLMWEDEDIVASCMHNYVQYARAFLEPPGDARSDREWIDAVSSRINPPIKLPSRKECYSKALKSPAFSETALDELRTRGFVKAKHPGIVFLEGKTARPDGRFLLVDRLSPEPDYHPDFPLRLLSLIRGEFLHSQILPEDHSERPPYVWVSESSPFTRDIRDGALARIITPVGSMRVKVKKLPEGVIHPRVVIYRRDDWWRFGGGINRIVADEITDMGVTAAYYQQCARIETEDDR